ncbi:hypothetical protein TNCV_3213431 [Trichonephila clavipes]|nr:hypothetical protein TNCV_3213431 [Trichonephila clavipes]
MIHYYDEKCTLPMCVHYVAVKQRCDHVGAVNKIWINLKKDVRRAPSFVFDQTIEDAPICDAASRVVTVMFFKVRVHTAANIVEL